MIVHNITQLITEFIIVDDDGNVVGRRQARQTISILSEDEFLAAYNQIVDAKTQLGVTEDAKRDKDNRPSE